jgi:hypothetical protein
MSWFAGPNVGVQKRTEMTPLQLEFLEWLVDPERMGSQVEWAKTHDMSANTLSSWKRETYFRTAWDARLKELNISPERTQRVIDAIFDKAVGGDTKAASLFLQYIERFTPKQTVVVHDRAVADLSDAELSSYLGGRE